MPKKTKLENTSFSLSWLSYFVNKCGRKYFLFDVNTKNATPIRVASNFLHAFDF